MNIRKIITRSISLCILAIITACSDAYENKKNYMAKGSHYFTQQKYDKARIEFKNDLQIDPKSADAHNFLGKIEEQRNEWRNAVQHYSIAIELNPDLLDAHLNLAKFHLLQAINQKRSKMGADYL